MPRDSIDTRPSTDLTARPVGVDTVGGIDYQVAKIAWGDADTATEIVDTTAGQLPVGGLALGIVTETAPATDTASSGLNGRLQRIAQRLTTLIANMSAMALQLPAGLSALGALKTGPAESTATMTVPNAGTTPTAGIDTTGIRNMALLVPSSFDGSTVTFTGCDTLGGTYLPIYDIDNNQISMTVAASRIYDLPGELMAIRFFKIVTGTAQTGATDFILLYRS